MSIQATNNNKKFKINKLSTQNKNKYIIITRRTQRTANQRHRPEREQAHYNS